MMQKIWLATAVVLALVLGGLSYQWLAEKPELQHTLVYPSPRPLKQFQLTDHLGQNIGPAQLQGQWTLAFVGYTFCPDICPLTLATLSGAYIDLQQTLPKGDKLAIWFISVDPQRDTQSQLNTYVSYFAQPALTGVTAGHDQLFPFVRELGLMYAISSSTDTEYRVDHSGSVVLINPQGQLVAVFKPQSGDSSTVPLVSKAQLLHDLPLVLDAITE